MVFSQLSPSADYPTKTVQIVNPFPLGAVTDLMARLITGKLTVSLGQSTIVVNKTGQGDPRSGSGHRYHR